MTVKEGYKKRKEYRTKEGTLVFISPTGVEVDYQTLSRMFLTESAPMIAERMGYNSSQTVYDMWETLKKDYLNKNVRDIRPMMVWHDVAFLKTTHRLFLEKRRCPSLIEIGKELNADRNVVNSQVKKLKEEGYVDYERNQNRTLHLTDKGIQKILGDEYLDFEKQFIKELKEDDLVENKRKRRPNRSYGITT